MQRAQAIIDELSGSLDMARGGELSQHLRGLYNYLDRRLDESNRTKTPEGIRECIERLGALRTSWSEMLSGGKGTPQSGITAAAA